MNWDDVGQTALIESTYKELAVSYTAYSAQFEFASQAELDRLTSSEDLQRDLAEHRARREGDRTDPAAEEVFQQDIVSLRIKHVEYTALSDAKCAAEAAAKETAKTSMRKHILTLAPITTMGNNKPWAALVTWARKSEAKSVWKAMDIAPAMNSK